MSQTSTERLKDYLAQLPPQAQALLMREFERAIERGEDMAVATFVLEQLRKVIRGSDEARPRTDDPARLTFRPLEPFLIEGNVPVRPGQIRRTSLMPIWTWLVRDGAPEAFKAFQAALKGVRAQAADVEDEIRSFQLAAAEAIAKVAAPTQNGEKQRALARVGPAAAVEDLVPIGAILNAHEALDTLGARLPAYLRLFDEPQLASVIA